MLLISNSFEPVAYGPIDTKTKNTHEFVNELKDTLR